jgi:hypothetical protein
MSKLLNKLYVRIIIAIVFGFLLASQTGIQGPCTVTTPGENKSHCVEFSKALEHPSDLINNKQNSLTRFSETLAISSLVSFALLSVYHQVQTKKKA